MDDHTRSDDPPSPVDQQKLDASDLGGQSLPPLNWQASAEVGRLNKMRKRKISINAPNTDSSIKIQPPKTGTRSKKDPPKPVLTKADKPIRKPRFRSDNHPHEQPIARLFKECEDAVTYFRNAGTRREHVLIKCLQKAAELYEYGRTQDPEGYRQLLADHNIRVTKRTGNPFTPVVKLVFHALNQEKPSTLSRYASVLRYARDEDIAPANFSRILTEEGGIEACAKHDRGIHSSPERAAAIKKRDEYYRSLQAVALNPDFSVIGDQIPMGLSAILVEKDEHGQIRLLGIKQEKFLGVQRYLPLPEEA